MPSAFESQCNSSSPLDLEDIEDLFSDGLDGMDAIRRKNRQNVVVPKVKKKYRDTPPKEMQKIDLVQVPEDVSSFLPGRNTIYIRTWGCAHNSSDSEYMAGQLVAQGYT
jgi:threonylcarbamoyladenosine tRNA methylthiotransferase CDKAL1